MIAQQVFQIEDIGDVTVVSVLCSSITSKVAEELMGYKMFPKGKKLILDLSNLSYLGSVGIGVLVVYLKRINEHNGRLAIAGLDEECKKVINICKLTDKFDLYPDVASALESLGSKEVVKR